MMRALADAYLQAHRDNKHLWLALGRTEEEWKAREQKLKEAAQAIPEPDYP